MSKFKKYFDSKLNETKVAEDFFKNIEFEYKELANQLLNHFQYNLKMDKSIIPKELINNFKSYGSNIEILYSGSHKDKDYKKITSWSYDDQTAEVFADHYGDDGVIYELTKAEFKKLFDFVSLDAVYMFLEKYCKKNKLDNILNIIDSKWYSENEILVINFK